ncbi:MAG: type II secretion system protein [Eubacterium sp.]|nr:type II secretion system protein [Eubacterium sp.]
MKNTISRNKGYSIIELVIVVAIIAITSSMAMVSVTMLNTARAKDAALKLDGEVAELIQKNKNMTPGTSDTAKYGLMLYYDYDDQFKISLVECDHPSPTSSLYQYKDDGSGHPVFNDTVNISKRVDIEYDGTYQSFCNGASFDRNAFKPSSPNGTGAICIMFDKQGNCISGYGKYSFKKRNGNVVSTVTIRQNGSHVVR